MPLPLRRSRLSCRLCYGGKEIEGFTRNLEQKVKEQSKKVVELHDRVAESERLASVGKLAAGFVAAAIVGWFSTRWLLYYLNRHSLYLFAAYCAIVGIIVLLVQYA